jgi:hypothetical protein
MQTLDSERQNLTDILEANTLYVKASPKFQTKEPFVAARLQPIFVRTEASFLNQLNSKHRSPARPNIQGSNCDSPGDFSVKP